MCVCVCVCCVLRERGAIEIIANDGAHKRALLLQVLRTALRRALTLGLALVDRPDPRHSLCEQQSATVPLRRSDYTMEN